MSRRNDHSREEIKEMAIAAAIDIIKNEGFANFSGRKVAKQINYTVGTIYNVFGNQADFILHINALTLDNMSAQMRDKLQKYYITNPSWSVDSHLDNVILTSKKLAWEYIDYAENNLNLWRTLFEFNLGNNELPDWYAVHIDALFNIVAKPLEMMFADRELAMKHAKILWAGVHGICQLALTDKLGGVANNSANSAQTFSDTLVENYLKGLLQ